MRSPGCNVFLGLRHSAVLPIHSGIPRKLHSVVRPDRKLPPLKQSASALRVAEPPAVPHFSEIDSSAHFHCRTRLAQSVALHPAPFPIPSLNHPEEKSPHLRDE